MRRHHLLALVLSSACSTPSGPQEAQRSTPRDSEVLAASTEEPAPAAAVADKRVEPFIGGYRHSGGRREQEGLENAVDVVVSDMNVIVREVARKRLLEANRIPATLEIGRKDDEVTIAFDDRRYTAKLGGPPVDVVGITGDPLRMTLRMRETHLVQTFVGDRGGRTNTMRRNEDEVRIAVVVESDALPRDLVYELTYKRP